MLIRISIDSRGNETRPEDQTDKLIDAEWDNGGCTTDARYRNFISAKPLDIVISNHQVKGLETQ